MLTLELITSGEAQVSLPIDNGPDKSSRQEAVRIASKWNRRGCQENDLPQLLASGRHAGARRGIPGIIYDLSTTVVEGALAGTVPKTFLSV